MKENEWIMSDVLCWLHRMWVCNLSQSFPIKWASWWTDEADGLVFSNIKASVNVGSAAELSMLASFHHYVLIGNSGLVITFQNKVPCWEFDSLVYDNFYFLFSFPSALSPYFYLYFCLLYLTSPLSFIVGEIMYLIKRFIWYLMKNYSSCFVCFPTNVQQHASVSACYMYTVFSKINFHVNRKQLG